MPNETTQSLIDLVASISHDPDEEDWFDVDEVIENLTNSSSVLRDILKYMHQEFL